VKIGRSHEDILWARNSIDEPDCEVEAVGIFEYTRKALGGGIIS
jgi:hypothetical protein